MPDRLRCWWAACLLGLVAVIAVPVQAQLDSIGSAGGQADALPVAEAFPFQLERTGPRRLLARWSVQEGYYLYRDKIAFRIQDHDGLIESVDLPPGETHDDEYFGEQRIYREPVTATIQLARAVDRPITVATDYQGCAESGLCYPPQSVTTELKPSATPRRDSAAPLASGGGWIDTPKAALGTTLVEGEPLIIIAVFALAGLALAFTACLYPMIPILSGLIAGDRERGSAWRALGLSLVYVEATAITYAAAGVLAGLSGSAIQADMQSPWVLAPFAGLFVVLALSMFGLFELQLPAAWQTRITAVSSRQRGGTVMGVAVMGVLSTLIVGACSGPALAAALAFIARTGDFWLGGTALFALANGMGLPLLLIGVGAGKWLPRAGGWMATVRKLFGVVFLGVALWLLGRVLPGPMTLAAWGALLVGCGVFAGAFDGLGPDSPGWHRVRRAAGLVLVIWGAVALVGASAGGHDLLRPLASWDRPMATQLGQQGPSSAGTGLDFRSVDSVNELETVLTEARSADKPVLIDVYADWCVSCVELEEHTFTDDRVQELVADAVLLRVDVTAQSSADEALQQHLSVVLPPAVIFYGPDGNEAESLRVVQFLAPEAFIARARRGLAGGAG